MKPQPTYILFDGGIFCANCSASLLKMPINFVYMIEWISKVLRKEFQNSWGLAPVRCQATSWTKCCFIVTNGSLEFNFSEIWIKMDKLKKMNLKIWTFSEGLNVLNDWTVISIKWS